MLVALFTGIYLAVGIYWLGRRRAGFDHRRRTISELGERGAADANLAAWGLFFPVGVAMTVIWFLHRQSFPEAGALAGAIAVGYVGAAIFPCDPNSPSRGSTSQGLHNLTGGVEYIGGGLSLLAIGRQQPAFLALAAVVGVALPLISLPAGAVVRGTAQRVAEICLIGGLGLALGMHRVA